MNCLWEPHVSQTLRHLLMRGMGKGPGLSMEGLDKTGCQMWGTDTQELSWLTVRRESGGWLVKVRV